MGFNIPMGVGSALSGAAGAYNQYAVEERQFEKQKSLEEMAFDNYLKKQSQANEMQFEQEKKLFNWKNEQEKLQRKAQAEQLKYTWDQDNDTLDEETKEYRKWSLDLWPIYGERTPEVVNSYLNGKDRKLRKDLDAQSEYIDRVNTALQSASPEQLRDSIWQSEVKRNARMGLKVRDISLFDKVDDSYFPTVEKESPTNIPNDLEAFALQHPLAKGKTYSSLPVEIRQSIYKEWDEKKVSNSNARLSDEFVIAARELYPGIDPQHITGEAIANVREHMAKNKAVDAGKRERAVQDERPMDASVQTQISSLQTALQMAEQTEVIFNDNWVGKLDKHKGAVREYTGWIEDDEVILRGNVESMKDMLLRAKSGAQINEAEYTRLSRLVPDTNMQSNVFKAAMKRFKNELSLTIENKIKFATTPKKDLKKTNKLTPEQEAEQYLKGK